MKGKEKLLICIFGVLVSFGIFAYILVYCMNFADIRLRWYGDGLMKYMKNGQFEHVYAHFYEGYGKTAGQFTDQQKLIYEILGEMKGYKLKKLTDSKAELILVYEAAFENYPGSKNNVSWSLLRNNREWKVAGYKVDTDAVTLSEIYNRFEKVNLSDISIGSSDKIDMGGAQELSTQIIEAYKAGKYQEIYAMGNPDMKRNGSEDQFVRYMASSTDKYGSLEAYVLRDKEIGRDGLETKWNYELTCEKTSARIGMTVWVRMEDRLYLSGMKLVEGSW